MTDIIIRIGTRRHKVVWPDDIPVCLSLADDVVNGAVREFTGNPCVSVLYIGGWSWTVTVDGRVIGSVVVITDM